MKIIDRLLLIYSACLALALTISSFSQGFSLQNLILLALFLPVSGYFIWTIIRLARHHPTKTEAVPPSSGFSLTRFLTQDQPAFLITLSLYIALITAVISRALLQFLPISASL